VLNDETPATLASILLLKQSSETTAPATVKVKKGKAAKFTAKATSTSMTGLAVPGKVVAKEGKKTLDTATLKSGKAALNLGKKLTVGKHKITVTYLGTPSVKGSSATVVVKVVK
jgi:Bacterial Ig-like domain (group 3)